MKKIIIVLSVVAFGIIFSNKAWAGNKCQNFEPSLCMQIYAPAWCVSLSVGGQVVKRPLFAKGGNSCIAMESLRKKACDQGLSWKNLSDEEVHCVLLPR